MIGKQGEHPRVLGRQLAVEVPEEDLNQVHGGAGGEVVIQSTRTCDGEQTYTPTGRDCVGGGGADDDAYEY